MAEGKIRAAPKPFLPAQGHGMLDRNLPKRSFDCPDLTKDERFAHHAAVKGDPNFRFYSGMPLINDEGYALGTVCVFDFEPREPTYEQSEALRRLSRQTMAQLELRRKLIELSGARQALGVAEARSNELLLNILPAKIAEELKKRQRGRAQVLRLGDNHVHRLQGVYAHRRGVGTTHPGQRP